MEIRKVKFAFSDMHKIFQNTKFRRSLHFNSLLKKDFFAIIKTESETKDYSTMPRTFDFTAYFDDNEMENNTYNVINGVPYLEAGADYVISSIDELKELIRLINSGLLFSESLEC
jgi:hypothetical protein